MKNYHFTKDDIEQLKNHGLTEEQALQRLAIFKKDTPYVRLAIPATSGNGIIRLNEHQLRHFSKVYEKARAKTVKFTPASGAATRMFKLLHQFLNEFQPQKESLEAYLKHSGSEPLIQLFKNLQKLPFYDSVKAQMRLQIPQRPKEGSPKFKYRFVKFLLKELHYANLPKGLIPFHHYTGTTATPFEEHLKEAARYLHGEKALRLHFTVSPEHIESFKATFSKLRKQSNYRDLPYKISYSIQDRATDTLAVNPDNTPFRDKNNRLLFRPGGHGALLQNLNEIDADIIFIKNIDNVVLEKNLTVVTNYKKALAGLLLTIQDRVFNLLRELDSNGISKRLIETAEDFALEYFHRHKEFSTAAEIKAYFNRPIRVCGMVKNEGEPGGGPFWIRSQKEKYSLQIVESSQINMNDTKQANILKKSTHFNPVDLVCGVKDYRGKKFDLKKFVNPNQSFITRKYKEGKPLKALELPGLWNGSMAYWNSIFVEVPLETFNPVKTIFDLLRPSHQA